MASDAHIPELERVIFFNGQRLLAADLNEAQRALREMRWLHNRSLHGWGIGFGLAVSGAKGESQVTITPGYAVDCMGREIILTEVQTKLVPPVAGDTSGDPKAYFLTISYPDGEDLVVSARRDGVCSPGGAVRLDEGPRLSWLAPSDREFRHGLDLILAQAWVQNCQLARPLSFAERRSARNPCQPHIASGRITASELQWEPIRYGGVIAGFATGVDTSLARFHTTPAYQAHVLGYHLGSRGALRWVIHGSVLIRNPSHSGFRLEVMLPHGSINGVELNPPSEIQEDTLQRLAWSIVWMGVEVV